MEEDARYLTAPRPINVDFIGLHMWDSIVQEEAGTSLASNSELDAFEQEYNVRLPDDHRALLNRFGEGVLFNHFRIFGLSKIRDEAEQFQERWQSCFHWTAPDSALSEDEIANCVIIGDNFNSDELAVCPARPSKIFYLPADNERIVSLGTSLEAAIYHLVDDLKVKISKYPEDEQEEWDLRPVFNRELF